MSYGSMSHPLSSANFRGAIKWIVIVSGVLFLAQFFYGGPLVAYLGLTPVRVLRDYWVWQPITYLFLHGGFLHWLFNMLVLWWAGHELESRWGTPFFIKFFFICGLGAALTLLVIAPHSPIPTIGASGAVFGVLTAFAMMFPDAVMYFFFVIPMRSWQVVLLLALIEFFAGISGGMGLGRFAHLGGMATAYLYLRSADFRQLGIRRFFSNLWGRLRAPFRRSKKIALHEVTDDLVIEVDRILDKVSKQGADSLTHKEREIMARYSKNKH